MVGLLKGLGIKLQVLFMILRYTVCQEKNADTGSADGGVGEERVRIFPDAFQQFLQPFGGDMVYVCQPEPGPSADVLLSFAALEADSYGKTWTGRFFLCGGRLLFLCSVIAVFFGAVAYQCVIFDEIGNFLQSAFCRLHVRIAFEQADFDFCHNLNFIFRITAAKFVLKSGYG